MASIQRRPREGGDAFRVQFRVDGKQRSETFYDERAAGEFAALVDRIGGSAAIAVRDARDGQHIGGAVTVADFARHHVAALVGITEGTRKSYESYVARDIAGSFIGSLPIDSVTRDQAGAWAQSLTDHLSGKSIANRHSLLSAVFQRASDEGLRAGNPCRGVRLPRTESREMTILTQGEFAVLVSAIDERYQPLILVLAGTGLRWGEVSALQVGDLDLDATTATLRVARAWKRTGRALKELGAPKTAKGRRTVALSPELTDVVRPLAQGRRHDDFVFTAPEGGPVRHDMFHRRIWQPAVKTLNESGALSKRPRIHDLRHYYASQMIALGVPLNVVQQNLGHEKVTTTVDTYGHLMPNHLASSAAAASLILSQALPQLES